ncbi:helix-turn-helix domain-containing protein [Streptomyces sp. SHP22-7]|nr:helix-turn-helix domain-containing protein [Streptomyces sp. SHP22-7]
MNLVFRADGLNTGEFAFLMACCNHTDDRGYVIASMQQLADEAHMKERTARENKQRLIKRGLLASKDRYSPKNGARLADLYRVNIDLLKQMQRQPRDYGPTMIEELTFATPEENSRSTPPAESAPPRRNPPPPGGIRPYTPAESAPLLLPSSSPSSLSGVDGQQQESQGPVAGEREAAEPKTNSDALQVLAAFQEAGGLALNGTRTQFLQDATELLESRPLWWLIDRAKEMPGNGWTDLARHAARSRVPFVRTDRNLSPRPVLPHQDPDYKPGKRTVGDLLTMLKTADI